jgi:hypothetical protein
MNKLTMLSLMTFAFVLSDAKAANDWVGEYEFDLNGQSSHLVRCSDGIKLEVRDEEKDHICTVAGYKGLYFHSEPLEIRQLKLTKDMTEAQFRTEASGKLGRLISPPKITLIPDPVTKRPVRVVRQRQVPVTKTPAPVVNKQPAPATKRPARVVRQRQAPVTKQPAPVVNKQPTPVTKRPGRVVRQRQAPVTKSPAPVVNKQPTPVTKRPVRVVRQRQAPVTRKPAPVVNKQPTPATKRPVRVQRQKNRR